MKKFRQFLENTSLKSIISPIGQVPYIGDEKMVGSDGNIQIYQSPHGSYRYVYFEGDNEIVGAAQIVSNDQKNGIIAQIYVDENYRQQGIARKLIQHAQKRFNLQHSHHKTDDGTKFAKHVSL